MVNHYDLVPYASHAFAETQPANLSLVGALSGLDTGAIENATVLELGCASGGNIMPLAERFPNSRFVGIDYSLKQIEAGRKCIEDLGFSNIELIHQSIADVDADLGEFDFIIAHGLFSWVDADLQQKIFELCSSVLAQSGIAYISYNTLPGWSTAKTVRDALLFHTGGLTDPADQAQQARSMLDFLLNAVKDKSSSHYQALEIERKTIAKNPDYYLLHEYLERDNNPMYFEDFMRKAQSVGLEYVGDAMLGSMLLDDVSKEARDQLSKMDDRIKFEQYLDFIRNRRFRSSLLCHERANQVNGPFQNPNGAVLGDWYLSTELRPDKPLSKADYAEGVSCTFKYRDIVIKLKDRISKLMYRVLIDNAELDQTINDVAKRVVELDDAYSEAQVREHIFTKSSLIKLFFSGAMGLSVIPRDYQTRLPDKPKSSELARYNAAKGLSVTNLAHHRVDLDVLESKLLAHLNGERTLPDLVDCMLELVASGELVVRRKDDSLFDSSEALRTELSVICAEKLKRLLNLKLLAKT